MVSKIYQKDYFSYIFTLRRQYFEQNSWLNKAQEPQNMDILMHFSVAKDNHTKFKIKKAFLKYSICLSVQISAMTFRTKIKMVIRSNKERQ